MDVPVMILEKHSDTTDADWEGLKIGATVRLSRADNGWAQIDFSDGKSAVFPNDTDTFEALARNGFHLTPESALAVLTKVAQETIVEEFKQLLPPPGKK